jgi:hypothetical protein
MGMMGHMTPEFRTACEQAGREDVGLTASKLLIQAASMDGDELAAVRRLLIALGAQLTTWIQGNNTHVGISRGLMEVAREDVALAERWATWIRTGLPDDVPLRDAMADEIDRAIAVVLDPR